MVGFNPEKKFLKEQINRQQFSVELAGGRLDVSKENFEYPKDIQEKTCIVGYTKFKIKQEDIERLLESEEYKKKKEIYAKDEKDYRAKILEKYGFEGEDYWKEINSHQKESTMKYEELNPELSLLRILTNGAFPDKTYNHVIQPDDSADYEAIGQKEMYDDKFILGKLTNINDHSLVEDKEGQKHYSIRHGSSSNVSVIFDDQGKVSFAGSVHGDNNSDFKKLGAIKSLEDVYDNGMKVQGGGGELKPVSNTEFEELTKDKIMLHAAGGVATYFGDFFSTKKTLPKFGFDPEESPFKEYLQKVYESYEKIPGNLISKKNKHSINHLISSDKTEHEKFSRSTQSKFYGETMIPVMTGNTGLPELCWGHAKYAVIPTEKNFNLLIIQHKKPTESSYYKI